MLEISQNWTKEFYIPVVILKDDSDILAYALYAFLQC